MWFGEPVLVESLAEFDEVLEIGGFDQERAGAQAIGFVEVPNVSGGSQDDNSEVLQAWPLTEPAENFEAVDARHIKVQQE